MTKSLDLLQDVCGQAVTTGARAVAPEVEPAVTVEETTAVAVTTEAAVVGENAEVARWQL